MFSSIDRRLRGSKPPFSTSDQVVHETLRCDPPRDSRIGAPLVGTRRSKMVSHSGVLRSHGLPARLAPEVDADGRRHGPDASRRVRSGHGCVCGGLRIGGHGVPVVRRGHTRGGRLGLHRRGVLVLLDAQAVACGRVSGAGDGDAVARMAIQRKATESKNRRSGRKDRPF